MDRLKQIIEKLNAYIERLGIPFFSPGGILIVLLGLVILWWITPEFAKFLSYLIGGILLIWQISVASRRAAAAEKTAELTERGDIAERFRNAIEHLGNVSAFVRLDGIYALNYIAQEMEDSRKRVFEILCAHIRKTTTHPTYRPRNADSKEIEPAIQIQSILNLLFIEAKGQEIYKEFRGNLKGADSCEANLQNADLSDADLQEAILWRTNLQDANLRRAKLQNADLWRANLQNTDLSDANFQKANLKYAENLKVEQLIEARTLYRAKLPDGMKEEIEQKKPELLEPPKAKQES